MLAKTVKISGATRPSAAAACPKVPRQVVARANATTWDCWTNYISKHRADSAGAAKSDAESQYSKELAAAIRSSASSFQPRFTTATESSAIAASDFKLSQAAAVDSNNLPKDLRERLEVLGSMHLMNSLGLTGKALDCASISLTTTDIEAALCVSGVVVQQGLEKTAIISFVATETERQASWSRLEGLILHWGCSDQAGGAWHLPPQGWEASPNKVVDAGGAWQCSFEKQMFTTDEGNQVVYSLVMQLPLKGVLKSGGITFVLKATEGQNTRWLKDESTKKDFFVDLSRLPVVRA